MQVRRRSFIKYASLAAAGNLAGLKPFGALNALADTSNDYKALVCVFLFGGNDGNNTVIPFDTSGYATYAAARGDIALAQNTLLPLNGVNFALHPNLMEMQGLYNSGNAAIITNVGTLVQPTTRAQYLAGATTPSNLFSHPDQQLQWQNGAATGATQTGWAGRISDALSGTYNPSATIPIGDFDRRRHDVLQRCFDDACFRFGREPEHGQLQRDDECVCVAQIFSAGAGRLELRCAACDG